MTSKQEKYRAKFLKGIMGIHNENKENCQSIIDFAKRYGLNTVYANLNDEFYYIAPGGLISCNKIERVVFTELITLDECLFLNSEIIISDEFNAIKENKDSILDTLQSVYRNTSDGLDSDNIKLLMNFVENLPNKEKNYDNKEYSNQDFMEER